MKLGLRRPPARALSLLAFSVLAACSSGASTAEPIATPAPAAPAPPVPCADGTHRTLEGACVAFPTVSIARSPVTIAPVRDHHTSVVRETTDGPYLYVFGGTDDWKSIHDDVQRAKIAPDGTLSPFEIVGKLPAARAGHCIVDLGDKVFLAGGVVGNGPSPTSVVIDLGKDGKVGASAAGPNLPVAVMHLTCDRKGDWIYAMGGRGRDSKSTRMSARVHVEAAGVGAFENQTPLTPDRSHHASWVRGNRLYLAGGLTGDPIGNNFTGHKDVVSALVDDDGVLGPWEDAGTLPAEVSVTAALLHDDALYVVGGLEDGVTFTTSVRRAAFDDGGKLTPFVTSNAALPEARGHVHQLPTWGRFFYSVGGKNDSASLGTVDIGRFD